MHGFPKKNWKQRFAQSQIGRVNGTKTQECWRPDDNKPIRIKDIDDTVPGCKIKKGDAGLKGDLYEPWKLGAEATAAVAQLGVLVDFKKVCEGIMEEKEQ